jgi:hypothetical protein
MSATRIFTQSIEVQLNAAGLLTRLEHKTLKRSLLDAAGSSLWKLVLRQGVAREIVIEQRKQKPPRIVAHSQRRLTMYYDTLDSELGRQKIKLAVHLELIGDELTLWVDVVNKGKLIVWEVWLPMLDGLTHLSKRPEDDSLTWPVMNGQLIKHPLASIGPDQTNLGYCLEGNARRALYPGPMSLPWMSLFSASHTLYVASLDRTMASRALHIHREGRSKLGIGIAHFPEIAPSKSWTSEPAIVSLHEGDWHVSADKYRKWLGNVLPPIDAPQWIREEPAWQLTLMKSQFGKIDWNYDGILDLWKGAKQAGVNVLMLFAWWDAGHDQMYPDPYTPSKEMGGRAKLVAAIKKVQSEGGRVVVYTQGRLIDLNSEFWKREGKNVCVRNIWGNPYEEAYNFFRHSAALHTCSSKGFAIACHAHPRWREILIKQTRDVAKLGVDGILYDQIGGGTPAYLNYDPKRPHESISDGYATAIRSNVLAMKQAARKINPDIAIVSENVTDVLSTAFDWMHGGGFGCHDEPGAMPELFRYTVPDLVLSNRMVYCDEYADLNFATLFGLRYDLEPAGALDHLASDKKLSARVKQLCDLRRQYKDPLLLGRFVDTVGVKLAGDSEGVDARAFVGEKRSAIVCLNRSTKPRRVLPTFQGSPPTTTLVIDPAKRKGEVAPSGLSLHLFEA